MIDDAVTFLELNPEPAARSVLANALDGCGPYALGAIRSGLAQIDVRRHAPDLRVAVPEARPWQDLPAPDGFSERIYDVISREIGKQRRSIQTSRRMLHERGEVLEDGPHTWLGQTKAKIAWLEAVTMDDCVLAAGAVSGLGQVHPAIRKLAEIQYSKELSRQLTPLQQLRLVWDEVHPSLLMWDFDYTGVDLRNFVDAGARLGVMRGEAWVSGQYFSETQTYLTSTLAWPLYVERPGSLDDHLGLAVPEVAVVEKTLVKALAVLEQMTAMPRRYQPRADDLAIVGPARPRAAARRVVEKHGDARALATSALKHGQAAVRGSAATWLAAQGAASALPELNSALLAEGSAGARTKLEAAITLLDY
ncbi:hypothetical protein [Cellulomonas sp. URHE0023]|uniref:hypothetical protein n=1 Tax=Cellulomonas sp. URHE0023 TaxID=1380354 RepID=UPI0004861206|nr:hypothetical protein [Cellulomonas sp. URHE0023]